MAMSGMGVSFRVQPEVLDAKAQEVTKEINQMEVLLQNIQKTVSATKHYWIGEAGNIHRAAFQSQKDDIEEMLKRLKEHPEDLRKIAGTYRATEKMVENTFSQMPSNLID